MHRIITLKYTKGRFMNNTKKKIIKRAFIKSLPVMAGYLVLGAGFGILLQSKGFGVLWAVALSVFVYAGSMQYLAVDLLSGGASLISAAITTLAVNARHLFYGISMLDRYKNAGAKKPYLIFSLTDETYSILCSDSGEDGTDGYFFLSLFNQIYWIAGSVAGSLLGGIIPFSTGGIDFALTALFVTIFTDQWLTNKNHVYAAVGVISSIVCLLIFGRDNFLIPSMIVIALILTLINIRGKDGGRT